MKSAFFTDSTIVQTGSGGGTVSFHELSALRRVSEVVQVYQKFRDLFYEEFYPNNPFMYDYYIASLIQNPDEIGLAQFYGSAFTLCAKRLNHAKKFMTVAAHNLEVSLEEWKTYDYYEPPPAHLTDEHLFALLTAGMKEVTVICPSRMSAEYVWKKFGIQSVIIPHGTDLPSAWNVERPQFTVFHLSQFGVDKGQKYLLKAWQVVENTCPDAWLAMSSFGLPDVAVPPNLKRFTPYQTVAEDLKHQLFATASVYVQPTVTEGWGLSVGEAMGHGTPVIVTEGAGSADMVTDGKDGFIIPIRNPQAITDRIRYFYDNPSEIKRMGNNARLKAEQFSWDKIEEKYAKLFAEAIP